MITLIKKINTDSINQQLMLPFADIIKCGGLVAFPTETVYGLGSSALNATAVEKIFKVKNRPSKNPLIAHISDFAMAETIAEDVRPELEILVRRFWPGALTLVLKKRDCIPDAVSAGGNTVAVRCPSHPIAHELIRLSGVPIVAPSANLSGKPSPTCFRHVNDDLNGKVEGIIDGGECDIGIESTVVIPQGEKSLKILRPGAITPEMLESCGFEVIVDKYVLSPVETGIKVASPGMLYKHYAPRSPMQLVRGNNSDAIKYIRDSIAKSDVPCGVLCFDGEKDNFDAVCVEYGNPDNPLTLSKNLFTSLRAFDETDVQMIYARVIEPTGVGLGIYNRMLRAASFNIITV